jgi:transmembrane sensor
MEKLYKMPVRSVVTEEAVEWLIKLDSDDPFTPEDRRALTEWLSRSPVHREELNTVNAFWSNNVLTELMVPLGRHDAEPRSAFFAALRRRVWAHSRWAMAAVATLCVAVALIFLMPDHLSKTNGLYVTVVGQQKTVTLADGSRLQLNTDSQIEVRFSEKYRNVRLLQGEVHFDVAKHPRRPFRVYAGGDRVEAVGTAFTVYYVKHKDLSVLVTEGSVALASLDRPLVESLPAKAVPGETQPGEAQPPETMLDRYGHTNPYVDSPSRNIGVVKAGQGITLKVAESAQNAEKTSPKAVEISAEELARRLAWRQGVLIFNGDPLEQVVNEISRYTTLSIEIADPALREIQIGGRFKVGGINEVFNALETNFGLQVTHLGYNRVRLSAAPR